MTGMDEMTLDVAEVYGEDYTEPEDCPALTLEQAVGLLGREPGSL